MSKTKDFDGESENESRSAVSDSLQSPGLWNSPGQNTEVGSLSLLQGIFPTQGSKPGLLHCRWILYQLSHKGRPLMAGWEGDEILIFCCLKFLNFKFI